MPFNSRDGTGVALSSLFYGWPKERIAQLCANSAIAMAERNVCDTYYGLGAAELRRSWPLRVRDALRRKSTVGTPGATVPWDGDAVQSRPSATLRRYLHERGWLYPVDSCLTANLKQFLREFAPDLVYAAPAEFALVRLTRQIGHYLEVPVAVQIWDNWMSMHYRKGVGAERKRCRLDGELHALLEEAALRFGISQPMCDAFGTAYQQPFQPLPVSVDLTEWHCPLAERSTPKGPLTILYAGTVHQNAAYTGLADMSRAVERLNAEGLKVRFKVITAAPLSTAQLGKLGGQFTEFITTSRAELICEVGGADLLFLPVAFNVESHDFIKYSLPAKSAAYMASGTPMLVYAPADLPIATEAVHYGIAHVVSEQDIGQLTEGAYHMLCDQEARAAVSEAALGRVREAYNRPIIQERTRQLFVEAILRHGNGTV